MWGTRESKLASVATAVTAATAVPKLVKLPAHAKPGGEKGGRGGVWVTKFLLGGWPQYVRDSISTAVNLALAHEDETRRGEVRMNPDAIINTLQADVCGLSARDC